jgi:hypothetical protein
VKRKLGQSPGGFSTIELLAACLLLGVLATLCVQYFHAAAIQRRALGQRMTAIQEAASQMECLSARPLDELTPKLAAEARLSPPAAAALPGGEVEVRIGEPEGKPPAKRIVVLVRWRGVDDQPLQPVRLVAWKYQKVP